MSTPNHLILTVADGTQMHAYTAFPAHTDLAPGLILFQEAFGVNQHIRNVADRLAAAGYAVVAPELFHRTAAPGFEVAYTDFPSAAPHFQGLTPEGLTQDAQAAYDWLQGQSQVQRDQIGAIGFCLGGRVAFLANAALPLRAAVSYYGGGLHTLAGRAAELHAPHLFFWGGQDQHISQQQREQIVQAVDAAGKPYVNTLISYADHGFNCDERASYNPDAAAEAWTLTLAFLANKLR